MANARLTAMGALAVLVFSGCGGSNTSNTVEFASDEPSSSEQTPSEATPTVDETQEAIAALASTFSSNSTGKFGFTLGQAECVSAAFVGQFGVDGLQEMGLVTEDMQPGQPLAEGFDMPPVNASAAADATLSCVNPSNFIGNLIGGGGRMPPEAASCVADALGDDGAHDVLVGAFMGNPARIESAVTSALSTCQEAAPVDHAQALATLKDSAPRFRAVTDAQIDAFAGDVCGSLNSSGSDVDRVDRVNRGAGMTPIESISIITYSVYAFCPEHKADVNQWVSSL